MMNINRYLGLIIVCFLISNCSGDESSALIPEKALLVSPAENYPCLTGDSVSDTKIEVIFRWSPARYTDYYNLRITNLISNEVINKTNIKKLNNPRDPDPITLTQNCSPIKLKPNSVQIT